MRGRMRPSGRPPHGTALALALGGGLLLAACGGGFADRQAEAERLFAAGQVDESIKLLEQLAAEDPSNAEIQLKLGMALREARRPTEAVFRLSKAAASEEYGVDAGVLLANTLNDSANYEDAIAAAERVLEKQPDSTGALLIRANAALRLHRGDLALETIDRLQKLEPDSVTYRHLRADALVEAKRQDEAEALLLELMKTEAESTPGLPQRACVTLAKLYADTKRHDRALDELKECEARSEEQPASVPAIVEVYDQLERDDEGTAVLRRAVDRHPDAQNLRVQLANRLIAADQFDQAEQLVLEEIEENATPERWAVVASVRQAAGNLKGALEAIDRAIALSDAPDQRSLFTRGDIAVALGDLDVAREMVDQLEEPLYSQTLRARIAQETGRPQEALDLYAKVLPNWPQNYVLRTLAALAALDLGDRDRARQELLEATRHAPKESDAAIWLARLEFAKGDYVEAASMARRQIQFRGPTQPDAYLLAARAYSLAGQPRAAKAMLQTLASVRDGLFKAHAIAAMGRLRAPTERKGVDDPVGAYEKLLEAEKLDLADPRNEPALVELLQLLTDAGRLKEATVRLDRLVAGHPDRPVLHALQGRVALLRGEPAAAKAAFDRALELDPELPAALAGRALLLQSAGDLAGASEAMDRAWQLGGHPDYGYMAARLQLDQGHGDEAEARLSELLRLHPDHAAAANDRAWLLAERGERLEEAYDLALLAMRLTPGPAVLDTLGYVQLKQGNTSAAIGSFQRALDELPEYATARYHLALALHEGGRDDEARENLEAALRTTFPESEAARSLLARLGEAGGSVQ